MSRKIWLDGNIVEEAEAKIKDALDARGDL